MFVVKIIQWCSIKAFLDDDIIPFSHKNTNHHKEQLSSPVQSPSERKTGPLISQVCSMHPLRFYLRENSLPNCKREKDKLLFTTSLITFDLKRLHITACEIL